jgi:hypothetical protein
MIACAELAYRDPSSGLIKAFPPQPGKSPTFPINESLIALFLVKSNGGAA